MGRWEDNTNHNRASHMKEIVFSFTTLADEKNNEEYSVGTASDYAGVTTEANRRSVGRKHK